MGTEKFIRNVGEETRSKKSMEYLNVVEKIILK
jgi:hypothetical protein